MARSMSSRAMTAWASAIGPTITIVSSVIGNRPSAIGCRSSVCFVVATDLAKPGRAAESVPEVRLGLRKAERTAYAVPYVIRGLCRHRIGRYQVCLHAGYLPGRYSCAADCADARPAGYP